MNIGNSMDAKTGLGFYPFCMHGAWPGKTRPVLCFVATHVLQVLQAMPILFQLNCNILLREIVVCIEKQPAQEVSLHQLNCIFQFMSIRLLRKTGIWMSQLPLRLCFDRLSHREPDCFVTLRASQVDFVNHNEIACLTSGSCRAWLQPYAVRPSLL
jgi:hypothetical protein